MGYESFIEEYLSRNLLKRQKASLSSAEKIILRSEKDLKTARLNLSIDEGIAYAVAYLAMLRAGRAYMLLKGFRPIDGFQHKTVVEFMANCLKVEYKNIVERFDRMRRKRNTFTYEIDIVISHTEAESALNVAKEFVDLIKSIIKKENPQTHFKF
jgi:uncharacterized protein (UPF0332 family)